MSSHARDLSDNALLYHGIKNLLRCDEAEVVAGIARYVMSQHSSLGAGSDLMERRRGKSLPSVAALAGASVRFLEVVPPNRRDGVLWLARLSNERKAIDKLLKAVPELNWTELRLRRRPAIPSLIGMSENLKPRVMMNLAQTLHRRYEFFKVLRAIELIGYYSSFLHVFRRGNYRVAVMSSHSNPHGLAFNLAARRSGVPVVLVSHGMPVRPVARLRYDFAIVHCEDARQTYFEEGSQIDRVMVHGRKQDYAPFPKKLPSRMSVGIFLCKDVNERALRALVTRVIGDPRVKNVIIRPHPKNLWRGLDKWVEREGNPKLSLSVGLPVETDLKNVDVVLAGNSSVLVDAVTFGRPALYVSNLDHGPHDMHGFVERGLIYPLAEEGSGAAAEFAPEDMLRFYQTDEWPNILRRFSNIDEDEASVMSNAGKIIRALASA